MKPLCTCVALALVAATAHGSFADGIAQGKKKPQGFRSDDPTATTLTAIGVGNKHCTEEINAWREKLVATAPQYKASTQADPNEDLGTFLGDNKCSVLKSGGFTHIVEDESEKVFVISATRQDSALRTGITCDEAIKEWEKGFDEFSGGYPAGFEEKSGAYANPNAVGLVSLLSEEAQTIYCGTANECGTGTLICYFKPAGIEVGLHPVTHEIWHKVEESHGLKPTLEPYANDSKECLDAINAVRTVAGLDLPQFTALEEPKKRKTRETIGDAKAYEEALYNLTCDKIKDSTIEPTVADEYTLIYAIKNGEEPPTPAEAVDFWKTGFLQLGTEVPPAFPAKGAGRADAAGGEIYKDNAVAGFVSLMVDDPRKIKCYNAKGCANAALICFLSGPTLVETSQPISVGTWKKILALHSEENGESDDGQKIVLAKRDEEKNCLTEINEFRTQDSLALKEFIAEAPTSREEGRETPEAETDELLKGLTCAALKAGNANILDANTNRSLMYYSGTSASCSEAVDAWKKGYEKFSDVIIPPKYTSKEELYKTGAATNFISLVSEGADTTATCYTATGCTEEGLVCMLKPAVFEIGKLPITKAAWKKVTETLSNGITPASVYGTMLSSFFVAGVLSAFSF
ncbi:SAG family member [Eimeria brunetti]|uniref:SAG family member n=1 Tax=Eimeria brunetti TaxID=51314 RepID=U6LKA5_9EIME|nr:SAG family member [Eimeria brunetti]